MAVCGVIITELNADLVLYSTFQMICEMASLAMAASKICSCLLAELTADRFDALALFSDVFQEKPSYSLVFFDAFCCQQRRK